MASELASIVCKVQDAVATVTLNKPPLNIMDIAMIEELHKALTRIHAMKGVKVLVVSHEGKVFSAGVSVQDHSPDKVGEMLEKFHGMFRTIDSLPMPSIALVDGMALGGGCELAVYCDMVLASDRATFGQPEIKLGVFPPVAAVLFPRLIGRNKALELVLTGEAISAGEAKAIGLVNQVFPALSFRQKVNEFISRLTSSSGTVLKLAKRAVDRGLYGGVTEGIRNVEQLYLSELMQTEDAREGLNAFLEKRKPVWREK